MEKQEVPGTSLPWLSVRTQCWRGKTVCPVIEPKIRKRDSLKPKNSHYISKVPSLGVVEHTSNHNTWSWKQKDQKKFKANLNLISISCSRPAWDPGDLVLLVVVVVFFFFLFCFVVVVVVVVVILVLVSFIL